MKKSNPILGPAFTQVQDSDFEPVPTTLDAELAAMAEAIDNREIVFHAVYGQRPQTHQCLEQLGVPESLSISLAIALDTIHTQLSKMDARTQEYIGQLGLRTLLKIVEAQPGHAQLPLIK